MISPATTALAQTMDVNAYAVGSAATAVSILGYSLLSTPAPGQVAGVEVEVWVNYLIERFWKDNQFLKHVYRDDQFVLAGKVVHIPQIGAKPEVIKNRSLFPATAVGRTDTEVNYSLDVYTTTPTHIQDAENHELSYQKIESVYGDHAASLNETIADDTIIKWLTGLPGSAKMLTTGGSTAATADDATGLRKLFLPADIRRVMTKFNKDGVPQNDRYIMPSANMLDQLISSMSDTQYKDFSSYLDAKNGVIGKFMTFTFLDRSSTAVADSTNSVKALGTLGAAGDNETTLLWQKDSLAAAIGDVKFFDNVNDPQYYGDIYSALMRAGGRRRRADNKGIVQLTQDVAQ